MSVGLPILATDVAGNCDTFEQKKSGFLYPLGDINCAAKYLRKLANDCSLREKLGKASFKRQRDCFSLETMRENYTKFYFDIKKL